MFSYLNTIAFGIQHFAARNRKFNMDLLSKRELIPLTADAAVARLSYWQIFQRCLQRAFLA